MCEDETTTLGVRAQDPTPCCSEKSLLGWNSSLSPAVAEKPRWYLGRHTPAHLVPIEITGKGDLVEYLYVFKVFLESNKSGLFEGVIDVLC